MREERERIIRLAFAALCIAASIALVMAAAQNSGVVAVPILDYLPDRPMASSEPESHQTNELPPPISRLGPLFDCLHCQMDPFDPITPG
jgi:hypothetical protein